jgi:hypothetical protein
MRVVWSIFVVCLVAAGGVARAEPRCESRAPSIARSEAADAVIHAVSARPSSHIASTRTRSLERRLPPAALHAAFALRAPSQRVVVELPLAEGRAALRLLATASARGPPIA